MSSRIGLRALQTGLRANARAVERARQELLEALSEAETAQRAERRAVEAISDEAAMAASIDSTDIAVEAFAAWLPGARRAVADTKARRDEVEARVVLARAVLAAARTAEAATEALLARHKHEKVARAARVEQLALDEAAARRVRDHAGPDPAGHDAELP